MKGFQEENKKRVVDLKRENSLKNLTERNSLQPSQTCNTFRIAFVLKNSKSISLFEECPFQFLLGVVLYP